MKLSKQILRALILTVSIIAIYNIKGYCAVNGTKRMEITGGNPWVNIDVSHAYTECESLNSTTSTLGTNNLRAHLTTDADWSAMAIFSISQYGDATTNTPESTTGNLSGVYNPGRSYTFSTGILSTANLSTLTGTIKTQTEGLFNGDGTLKPYMKEWFPTRTDNNVVWFNMKDGTDQNGIGTYGWFNAWTCWGNSNAYPISIKNGLFGGSLGHTNSSSKMQSTGYSYGNGTFRPVIWN